MVPINGSGLTRVALLNDFSCFGKCSLTVSIPIISSYGIETVPLPTAVLSTHTGGFDRFVMRDMTEDMRQIAAHWKEMDMQFDCIYTGFFCTKEQIAFAREFIRTFSGPQTIVLSDPVLGDNGSLYSCFSEDFAAEMRKLCEMADIITPNLTELCTLIDAPYPENGASIEELKEMCGKLAKRGPKHIVVTGIHFNQTQIANFIYNKGEDFQIVMVDRIGGDRSGTGDVIAAIIAGMYLNGHSLYESVKKAADYVSKCIRYCEENEVPSYWGLCFEMFMKDLTEEA